VAAAALAAALLSAGCGGADDATTPGPAPRDAGTPASAAGLAGGRQRSRTPSPSPALDVPTPRSSPSVPHDRAGRTRRATGSVPAAWLPVEGLSPVLTPSTGGRLRWTASPGRHVLRGRVVDGDGRPQDEQLRRLRVRRRHRAAQPARATSWVRCACP